MTSDTFFLYNKIQELLKKSFAMAILNLSPDSFSGDGATTSLLQERIEALIASGVGCIDIGAQSTRRGAVQISIEEEETKIRYAVLLVRQKSSTVIISVDTTRASVAKVAIEVGADIINDISGGQFDNEMYDVIKAHPHVIYVLGHVQGTFESMHASYIYKDVAQDLVQYANTKISFLEAQGIKKGRIIFDPCIGFSKNKKENLAIIRDIEKLVDSISAPVLIGLSRKGFIKTIIGQEDNDSLDRYTLALYSALVSKGVKVIRTHEIIHTMNMLALVHQIYEQ